MHTLADYRLLLLVMHTHNAPQQHHTDHCQAVQPRQQCCKCLTCTGSAQAAAGRACGVICFVSGANTQARGGVARARVSAGASLRSAVNGVGSAQVCRLQDKPATEGLSVSVRCLLHVAASHEQPQASLSKRERRLLHVGHEHSTCAAIRETHTALISNRETIVACVSWHHLRWVLATTGISNKPLSYSSRCPPCRCPPCRCPPCRCPPCRCSCCYSYNTWCPGSK
jgi:hypothetical protein